MIRFVLGLCGYVPAARLEAMRRRAQYAERASAIHAKHIGRLQFALAALRAQLPNRDKAGKFTRRI